MKLTYCILLLLCPYISRAQQPLKPLSVGQKAPNLSFSSMYNHTATRSYLYDFKVPLLIVDFWATWCAACLRKFPLLDSMQEAQPNNFKALLINAKNTNDTQERIKKTVTRLKTKLPTAMADTTAVALFPHRLLPHYVWLDSNFTIIAITGSEAITANNIAHAILEGTLAADEKIDQLNFDPTKPLFGSTHKPIHQSTLSGRIAGLSSASYQSKTANDSVTWLRATNSSIFSLLLIAHGSWPAINTVIVQASHPQLFISYNPDADQLYNNSFCYELITPPIPNKHARLLMQQDLARYFNLRVKKEEQLRPVYLLLADTSCLEKNKTSGAPPVHNLGDPGNRLMINEPISSLSTYLDRFMDRPVINQTTYTANIDLQLGPMPTLSFPALNKALKLAGLHLMPAERMVPVFIIY